MTIVKFKIRRQPGEQRGRKLGFPTINFDSAAVPTAVPCGVYAARLYVPGRLFLGLVHYGPKLTFHGDVFALEMHVFDFFAEADADEAELELLEKIREIRKFDNEDGLKKQISEDVRAGEAYFAKMR